jgi:transcriptional regulator with XRE-family HTH domain
MRYTEIYKTIRDARERMKLTKRELASRIGVSPQAIALWEKPITAGGVLPSLKRIPQLERALSVDFGDIELPNDDGHIRNAPHLAQTPSTGHDPLLERRVALIETVLHADQQLLTLLEAIAAAKR